MAERANIRRRAGQRAAETAGAGQGGPIRPPSGALAMCCRYTLARDPTTLVGPYVNSLGHQGPRYVEPA